jgi:ActR/RegA family two-component response regulator
MIHTGSKPHWNEKILLVDDDQQVRELFGLALHRSGYYVIEAHSGVAGFEMAGFVRQPRARFALGGSSSSDGPE